MATKSAPAKKKKVTTNKRSVLFIYTLIVMSVLAFSSLILYNMFKLSVVQAAAWNDKAARVLEREDPIEPERGKILADDGTVLAANMYFYVARVDWLSKGIKRDTLAVLLPALADSLAVFDPTYTRKQWYERLRHDIREIQTAGDLRTMGAAKGLTDHQMDSLGWKENHSYRLIKRKLSHNEFKRLKSFPYFNLGRNASGLYPDTEVDRRKPYGSMASRSIGTVETVDGEVHGKQGLESSLDSLLRGTPGVSKRILLTKDVKKVPKIEPINGYDITTTINVGMQDIVETELYKMCHETNAQWGTAILMEVATGEIKAISNLELNPEISDDYIEGSNNAVLGFEPGSVMKPISMMVALEDGIIVDGTPVANIDAPIVTGGQWTYAGSVIRDPHGGAALTPRQIIETSSNIGMSRIITAKYGSNPDGFRQRLEQMGFFEPLNCGISSARTPRFYKLGNLQRDRVALTRMAFGYSTEIPPLCTLAMYNAIANNGKYVRPRLIKKLSRSDRPDSIVQPSYIREQVCSPENAEKLRIMLHDVVWGSRGTARKWLQDNDVHIAGKTGTAYHIEPGTNTYGSRKRLAFCGFFPYENPKYSCIVLMLGANRGAAASSGMVLKNVALRMYARGLLDNKPDYRAQQPAAGDNRPTLHASLDDDTYKNVGRALGVKQTRHIVKPAAAAAGTMPNVAGLSAREAISAIEGAGMVVRVKGYGRVRSQSIAAGSSVKPGQVVILQLAN